MRSFIDLHRTIALSLTTLTALAGCGPIEVRGGDGDASVQPVGAADAGAPPRPRVNPEEEAPPVVADTPPETEAPPQPPMPAPDNTNEDEPAPEPPPAAAPPTPAPEAPPEVAPEEPKLGLFEVCEADPECESQTCGLCDSQSGKRFCYQAGARDLGEQCHINDECAVGVCSSKGADAPFGGVCFSGAGKCICQVDADCDDSKYCTKLINSTETACVKKKLSGGPCKANGECLSGLCDISQLSCM